jgi:dipeptidyl aminopeptidase/acylaminoacyl peptidase
MMFIPARLVVLLLATAATLAAALAPAAGAWPGTNGQVVFGAYQGGGEFQARGLGLRIAPLGASRSERTPLTEDPGDGEPQGSPDGRLVVFARASSTEPQNREPSTIYVIGADGSSLRPLTDGRHVDREPAFSASGERVYFTRERAGIGGTDIFSVGLGGGGLRRITSGEADDFHPRAAPGGRIIAFERRVVGPHSVRYHHIFTARVDGSRVQDLTPKLTNRVTASDPEFSPDGRRVAYSAGDRLISVRPDGSRPRLLIPPRPGSDYIYADPTYSPDARSLLFTILAGGGRTSLRRLDLADLRPLPSPLVEPHIGVRSPSWLAVARDG